MKRLGVLGGTFDPPHRGHLTVALEALKELALDQVIWIPAAVSPHKVGEKSSARSHRLEMVQMMTSADDHFVLDDREMNRPGPSFTVDTLRELTRDHADSELFLILGEDSLRSFATWKNPDTIRSLARLIVYRRLESGSGKLPPHNHLLSGLPVTVSSTDIRNLIRQKQSVDHLVTADVEAYIHAHKLYLSS